MRAEFRALAILVFSTGMTLSAAPSFAAGALVSSPVYGGYYYMTHRSSEGQAVDLAMEDCGSHFSSGCHLLKAYHSGCLAIAQSHNGSHHSGWAVEGSDQEAQLLALGECTKYGIACTISVNACE